MDELNKSLEDLRLALADLLEQQQITANALGECAETLTRITSNI